MNKEILIELTNKLYKMTLLFPKKEPLRYKIRKVANEILANFVFWQALQSSNPGNLAANWEMRYRDLIFLLSKDLGILRCYFEIAKWQNWLNYFEVLEMEKEYDKIKDKIEEEIKGFEMITKEEREQSKEETLETLLPIESTISFQQKLKPQSIKNQTPPGGGLRKEKILEILEQKGRAQVWQVKEIFPGVSKRTLRRDFEKLFKQGLVERIGERNEIFYQLKS